MFSSLPFLSSNALTRLAQDTTQEATVAPTSEQEPLLGRPGDVAQGEGASLLHNFVAG